MRDFENFPAEENSRGRGHCLNDKDNIAIAVYDNSYPIDGSNKCRENSGGVASSCANITKQPWYNCQGQGHWIDNQKSRKELANGKATSQKGENLHTATVDKKTESFATTKKKNAVKPSKDNMSILPRNQSQEKNGNFVQPEKTSAENKEDGLDQQVKRGKDSSPKDKEHSTRKDPRKLAVYRGEKRDKEKKNKSDIDRKNAAKQSRLRLNVKETSPKELVCDVYEKGTNESHLDALKENISQRNDHSKAESSLLTGSIKESDLKWAGLGTSYIMAVNQSTQLSQTQAQLSLQISKSNQLHRQKSAEEHMGELGNLVGDAHFSLSSLEASKELSLVEDWSRECKLNDVKTKLDNKKSDALKDELSDTKDFELNFEREMDHDNSVKRSADVELEDEVENDFAKDISSDPLALDKSVSGLQEDIKLAENGLNKIQKSCDELKNWLHSWTGEAEIFCLQVHTELQNSHLLFQGSEKYKKKRAKRRRISQLCPVPNAIILTMTYVGRGDKSLGPSPEDSEGNRKNSRKSSKEDLSEKENRNNDDEKDRDEKEDPPFSDRGTRLKRGASNELSGKPRGVEPNYRYRRKHGLLRQGQQELSDLLGLLQNLAQDIPPDLKLLIKNFIEDINPCLVICLRSQSGNDLENCEICSCLMALTSHFGNCNSDVKKCELCTQLFCLVQQHVLLCRARNNRECPVLVCIKISFLIDEDPGLIFTKEAKIWRKLKKYIGGFIQRKEISESKADEGETFFSMTSLTSINPGTTFGFSGVGNAVNPPAPSKRPSLMYMPSLTIIHEDQDRSLNVQEHTPQPPPGRGSHSEPILKKRPDGTVEALKPLKFGTPKPRLQANGRFVSGHPPSPMVTGPPPSFTIPKYTFAPSQKSGRKVSFARKDSPESLKKAVDVEWDAFPDSSTGIAIESEDFSESSYSAEPSSIEKTYGGQLKSVREGSNPWHYGETQFLSLKEKPTGSPGIGEVVYGYRDVLLKVIEYWEVLRQQYKEYGKLLNKSVKEEGVIYPDCKKKLMIMGHRYQKDFQWVRMIHLGRGMFGNCHLASDYNTEYQFCIKKIHISKYREDEIKIWSDLEHSNIVKFHGALRRKEKIYIISEFIQGGNLTEIINAQKTLMRRLSQRKALQFLGQLLRVLVYLEKKSVIHEDIKSDNILLRGDGREIVLADFGVARRQTSKVSSLVGTPTHFSPEKAESRGHDYKSDLWAALCVFLHILSGDPPWVKRYPNAVALQFLIATKPAPLEDIPHNIHVDVRNLIERGLEKMPVNRPTASTLLQHHAFQLINERGDNLYSVLPSGSLTEDDTHLPSTQQTGATQEILEEIEESINHPEKIEEIFNNKLILRDDITSILGKSQKVEDSVPVHPENKKLQADAILQDRSFGQGYLNSQAEASAVSVRILDPAVKQGQGDFKSRENSFLESLKKSNLATQEDILSEKIKDPSELIEKYLYDDLILNHFPFQEVNLTVLPLYVEGETASNHSGTTTTGEVQSSENLSNLPMFDNILSNVETDIDRLHTKVLLEQLSKTSSNSDLLAAASPSPQFNSGSHGGSSDFNQDHIIQTLMERPENDSEARSSSRSRSSTRSESTSHRSRDSSSSAMDESIMNLLEVPPGDTSCASNSTIVGNLPNSILFDFDSSKSKSSESFHTPREHVSEENVGDEINGEEKVGVEEKDYTYAEKITQVTKDEGDEDQVPLERDVKKDSPGQSLSKMIPMDLPDLDVSPHNTMFDDYDKNISDDDLFAVDETPLDSSKSEEEPNKTKSGNSLKDSSSLNLSGHESGSSQNEAMAAGPIRPFTIEKDPQDPSKQKVVVDTDPKKAYYPPASFKKHQRKLELNLRNPPMKDNTKRFSNPDVGGSYTPVTPQNYYTPQVNNPKPFTNMLPTPSVPFSPSSARHGLFHSPRSASPRSQKEEQEEEIEMLTRALSQNSENFLNEFPDFQLSSITSSGQIPYQTEEEPDFEYSLQFVMKTYITGETNEKYVKVIIQKLDGSEFTTKLSYEYSNKNWKSFVEEYFCMMKTNGVDMLTLCFPDNSPLDLQERPIDSQKNNHVTLKVVEVTEHGRDDLAWYCQNSICRVGGGIPV